MIVQFHETQYKNLKKWLSLLTVYHSCCLFGRSKFKSSPGTGYRDWECLLFSKVPPSIYEDSTLNLTTATYFHNAANSLCINLPTIYCTHFQLLKALLPVQKISNNFKQFSCHFLVTHAKIMADIFNCFIYSVAQTIFPETGSFALSWHMLGFGSCANMLLSLMIGVCLLILKAWEPCSHLLLTFWQRIWTFKF